MPFEWVEEIVPAAEMTEGPYYGSRCPERSDIREGRSGVNFELLIKVVDVKDFRSLPGISVDIWHCDAQGNYSGYDFDPDVQPLDVQYQAPTTPDTYLRGSQVTNDDGVVRFLSIFPGWYAARTPHIHVKVFSGDRCVLTTQLYIAEQHLNEVYTKDRNYARRVGRDTFNASDIVIGKADGPVEGCWIELFEERGYLRGESVLAVDVDAVSVRRPIPPGFRPPLGGIVHGKATR